MPRKQGNEIDRLSEEEGNFSDWSPNRSESSVGFRMGSVFDHMSDMYSFPDTIELQNVPTGLDGFEQDARNIRGYFRKALEALKLDG